MLERRRLGARTGKRRLVCKPLRHRCALLYRLGQLSGERGNLLACAALRKIGKRLRTGMPQQVDLLIHQAELIGKRAVQAFSDLTKALLNRRTGGDRHTKKLHGIGQSGIDGGTTRLTLGAQVQLQAPAARKPRTAKKVEEKPAAPTAKAAEPVKAEKPAAKKAAKAKAEPAAPAVEVKAAPAVATKAEPVTKAEPATKAAPAAEAKTAPAAAKPKAKRAPCKKTVKK